MDASGNVYVAGETSGTFPSQISAGDRDAFVRKYYIDGNEEWTSQFGTASYDGTSGISVDTSGNVYVAGHTWGSFPGQTSAGLSDAFVVRITGSEYTVLTITNITTSTDSNSATISWNTSEPADTLVKYGTEPGNYTFQQYDSAYVTSHSITLTDLLQNTRYYFAVNSTDFSGNTDESEELSFTVGKFSILLSSGWNLISIPLNLTSWDLGNESVIGNSLNVIPANCLSSIYRYNTTSGLFEKADHLDDRGWYHATGSESFTTLEPGRGYWVMAKEDCELIFTGTAPSDLNVALDSGWNLIGWYSMNEAALGNESEVGNPLNVTPANSLTSIYRYNTTLALFEKADHFDNWGWYPATGSENFLKLEPASGYWIMAKNDADWRHKSP